jgi:putative transposase
LGIDAAKGATRWEALKPVRQAVRRCFGAIRAQAACGHDHGSQYISADLRNEIRFLGIRAPRLCASGHPLNAGALLR